MSLSYEKLFALTKQKGITLNSLRKLKVEPISGKTIATIRKNGSVTLTTLCRICDALDCKLSDIVEYIPDPTSEKHGLVFQSEAKTIPLKVFKDAASAGYGNNDVDSNNYDIINVPNTSRNTEADYAVYVTGYSMLPMFTDGDIVAVKEATDVPVGKVGIFTINGETYIKQRGEKELISINPNFPNVKFSEGDFIVCNGIVLNKINNAKKARRN